MMLDAGLPPGRRLSKAERKEAKRWAQAKQQDRKWREAEIAKLEKSGEEITDAQLEELGLYRIPGPPDQEFLNERLRGARPEDFLRKALQALADLVASDVPLGPLTRQFAASELRRLSLPDSQRNRCDRDAKLAAGVKAADGLKHVLLADGMTPGEADAAVVDCLGKALGISNVESLNKKRQRARRRKVF